MLFFKHSTLYDVLYFSFFIYNLFRKSLIDSDKQILENIIHIIFIKQDP